MCYVNNLYQIFWDFGDKNKLHSIQNEVNKPYNFSLTRQDEVIFS